MEPMTDVIISPEVDALSKLYIYRQPEKVEAFLRQYPGAASLLRDARPQIDRYFGAHALRVELTFDEWDPDNDHLFAMIECDLDADDAIHRLHQLERNSWAGASYAARLPVNIDVEFAG